MQLLLSKELGKSVIIDCAAIYIGLLMLCFLAKSSEQTIAAAAPHVGGQHCRRVRGGACGGEASTCSTVTSSLKIALSLCSACLRALTEILAKVSFLVPYFF